MLPGVDFTEMLLVAVIAMVVMGPRDLPLMMRKFGRFTGKMRSMAFEFKQGFDELGRQAELQELRNEVASLKKHTGLEDLQKDLSDDQANLDKDVRSALAEPDAPKHPAAASAAAVAAATPAAIASEPAPYAGLSADHPGYDAGEDFRIDGAAPLPPTQADPASAEAAPEPGDDPHEVNGVHVVPDDEVRPAPEPAKPEHAKTAKQDAPA